MKSIIRITIRSLVVLGITFSLSAHAGTFYCPDGKQMKCLGFDKKIVDNKALCFDPLKCSQEGFVCKSELDALAVEHETLRREHEELVSTHNHLIGTYENTLNENESLQRCLIAAGTLEEAKGCM